MQIELYSFSKRKNSTKKPTSSGTVVSCVFKEETSVMSPSFELSSGSPIGYNYVKAWTNYYYITDCTFVTNGTWRISCRLDSLATYEATIKGMSAFIEYADTYDARIFDPRLAKKINAVDVDGSRELLPFYNSIGYCVVTVVGDDSSCPYELTYANAKALMNNCVNWLSSFYDYTQWTDVLEALWNVIKALFGGSPGSNIKSCVWIPANSSGGSLSPNTIHAGIYDTGIHGIELDPRSLVTGSFSLSVPHPASVMLRTSNNCQYCLYLPFIGNISLSADILADESTLSINYSLAPCSGEVAFTVKTGSGLYVGTYGANISAEIPIGASGLSGRSIANGLIAGAIAAGVTHGASRAAAGAGGSKALLGQATAANITSPGVVALAGLSQIHELSSSVGGLGSSAGAGLDMYAKVTCSYWEVSDSGSSLTGLIGNPYYKVDTIGNHGYVACSGASIDAIAYDDITNEINAYLRSGIYVE